MAAIAGVLECMCFVMGCKGCYSDSCLLSCAGTDASSRQNISAVSCVLRCMCLFIGLTGRYSDVTRQIRADLSVKALLGLSMLCCRQRLYWFLCNLLCTGTSACCSISSAEWGLHLWAPSQDTYSLPPARRSGLVISICHVH